MSINANGTIKPLVIPQDNSAEARNFARRSPGFSGGSTLPAGTGAQANKGTKVAGATQLRGGAV